MKKASLSALAPQRAFAALLVFILALSATLLAVDLTRITIRNAAERAFLQHVDLVEKSIRDRLLAYELAMRSGASFFAISPKLARLDWRNFVSALRIREFYPGVQGVHFAPYLTVAALPGHIAAVRAEGFADYTVRPAGSRDTYVPITWPEPFNSGNRAAMGFDMFSDATRRLAMEQARDSGDPTISARLLLAGGDQATEPGFVFYHPVYFPEMHPINLADRRAMLTGFVFCSFRMTDLMTGVLDAASSLVHIEIYDGVNASRENWLFDPRQQFKALNAPDSDKLWITRQLKIGEHGWSLYVEATDEFTATVDEATPRLLMFIGLVITALATFLTYWLLRAEAVAQATSMHDGLTGLYNRRYLEASLKREEVRGRRSKQPISIIQFDLDHFKRFNDTYGHGAGDEVLRLVSQVLRDETRGEDIVCRYGGEEFTVIMPGAGLDAATERAEKLRAAIAKLTLRHEGNQLPGITISGGVAVFPQHGNTLSEVLQLADTALIFAKREGRARIKVAEATSTLN